MRYKLLLAGLLLITLLGFSSLGLVRESAPSKTDRPNILFIISDDHTWQAVSGYGSQLAQTPNIDRIAQEGAIFQNCLITNSICGPSRATLLTGQYSHVNGYRFNERVFDNRQWVFPEALKQNGYQTAWVGKLHLGSIPRGFDYVNVLPGHGDYYNSLFVTKTDTTRSRGYVTNVISEYALDWLKGRDKDKPFMLVVGHKATHRIWLPDTSDLGAYDNVTFPLPPTFHDDYAGRPAAQQQDMSLERTMRLKEDLKVHMNYSQAPFRQMSPGQKQALYAYYEGKVSREFDSLKLTGRKLTEWKFQRYMRDYLATAKSLDRNIGRLLTYLDHTGLSKNTVVVYTSDQGFYLGEHGWFDKRFIYEESLRTPFVMRYPGVIRSGTVLTQPVTNVDWAPTLLAIGQTKVPSSIQGTSFLPLLRNPKAPGRQGVYYHYYEYPEPHHVSPHFGLRTNRYTLARFYRGVETWELYDRKTDPRQLRNIYNDPAYAEIVAQLKRQLLTEIDRYQDEEARQIMARKLN